MSVWMRLLMVCVCVCAHTSLYLMDSNAITINIVWLENLMASGAIAPCYKPISASQSCQDAYSSMTLSAFSTVLAKFISFLQMDFLRLFGAFYLRFLEKDLSFVCSWRMLLVLCRYWVVIIGHFFRAIMSRIAINWRTFAKDFINKMGYNEYNTKFDTKEREKEGGGGRAWNYSTILEFSLLKLYQPSRRT